MDVWEQIKERLASKLTWESYQNWLVQTVQLRTDGPRLWVSVPNDATKEWIEKEYSDHIRQAIAELKLPVSEVIYSLQQSIEDTSVRPQPASSPPPENLFTPPTASLNARYTFESFVVGSCNQFAHAAARAVTDMPARTYNPLFIYGGVGMGKTHLIHAIGRELLVKHPSMRIVYTASERFMNQLINCIRTDRMVLFHQHYRSADILLVDDIHILANKERTQEEFFHTFNELYDHQKQIVISSDSSPKNTPGLFDRLRSRFEWGLIVDVQPPDLETKMAIIDKKAETEGIQLPDDVRIFIATKTKSNVRELEGALIKLIAYSSVTRSSINIDMARQVLRYLAPGQERKVTIEAVIKATAERFSMQPAQIKHKSNARHIAHPRQVAMYLAKELTAASLPEIGRAFGGKHHTTVLHSVQKIEQERHRDSDLNRLLQSIIDSFH